jgi:predicted ATPase
MAIDFVKIQNFKSIREVDLPLKPINILIGANGSGKSNFISFFEFLNATYNQKLQEYVGLRGGQDKFIFHSEITQKNPFIELEISFDDNKNGYALNLQKGEDGLVISNEYLIYQKNRGWSITSYNIETNIQNTDNYRATYVRKYLESYRKYHFHDTGKNSPFSSTSHIENDSYFLYEKGNNLAAFLYTIKYDFPKKYNRIIKTIQSIAPFFSDFYFQPNKNGHLRLQWQSKHSDFIYGINDLSDGTIRFIALTTLFLQPNLPSSIIIDEPELGLHPVAIAKLAGMVKSAAARGTQVIMATQSVDLINHFEAEDIVTVDQIDGASQLKRLSEQDLSIWLEDYNVGDLWQRNILTGGSPNF